VGVTPFFEFPEGAPTKPRIGGFSKVRSEDVARLDPDLIITFSDVQANLTADLLRLGFCVLGTNQRTLAEVEHTLDLLSRVVDREAEAARLLTEFQRRLVPVEEVKVRPRVYFEEWNDPLVSGIGWVSELIERAGGTDIFTELREKKAASERKISPEEVIRRNPDVILASWCGRPVRTAEIAGRAGWTELAAVKVGRVFEIPSEDILQPGFRLVRGYEQIKKHIKTKD
jgi:iron complex transport system substrate-binding protein